MINISQWNPIKYHKISCRCAGCKAKNGIAWNKGIKTGISSKRINIERELLISLYYGNNYTLEMIGNLFGCTKTGIKNSMERYNIPRRNHSESRKGLCCGKNHPMYGKHHTRESKEMMSKSRIGIPLNHKKNCQCSVCKVKRGETCGDNHPQWKGGKRLSIKRHNAKRKRQLKFIPLWENPFPEDIEVDYHHINNLLVVPIPKITHTLCIGYKRNKHRELCNNIIGKIFNMNLDLFNNGVV